MLQVDDTDQSLMTYKLVQPYSLYSWNMFIWELKTKLYKLSKRDENQENVNLIAVALQPASGGWGLGGTQEERDFEDLFNIMAN